MLQLALKSQNNHSSADKKFAGSFHICMAIKAMAFKYTAIHWLPQIPLGLLLAKMAFLGLEGRKINEVILSSEAAACQWNSE